MRTFDSNTVPYAIVYFLLILFFAYFYATIQFNPVEVANNLKKNGGFIPGYRPGKPTSEFIQKVLNKVTLFGAVYLGIIACVPIIISLPPTPASPSAAPRSSSLSALRSKRYRLSRARCSCATTRASLNKETWT